MWRFDWHLGYHTTVCLVHLDLAIQGMAQQHGHAVGACLHQGHAGLVTRGLKTQHKHVFQHRGGSVEERQQAALAKSGKTHARAAPIHHLNEPP